MISIFLNCAKNLLWRYFHRVPGGTKSVQVSNMDSSKMICEGLSRFSSNLPSSFIYDKSSGFLIRMYIDCSVLQPRNASFPIAVTESGMLIDCRAVQPENAPFPIVVTESGMSIDCSALQQENALFPISVTESGMSMDCRALQPLNAQLPIYVTESGMLIDCRALQP